MKEPNMSEDKLQAAVSRGARAEALLQNELLQEAFAVLEHDYIDAWKMTPARATNQGIKRSSSVSTAPRRLPSNLPLLQPQPRRTSVNLKNVESRLPA
jgi:hypothetical protein